MPVSRPLPLGLLLAAFLLSSGATAQGFQLQQHEPAAAGDGFFGVRAPRFDAAHALVVGLSLNYGHHPLLGGRVDGNGDFVVDRVVISDQLVGHLDVSGALFGRLQLSASLPVTLMEQGAGGYGVAPASGVVGDPRFGVRVRLFGEERAPFRAHVGGDLWLPVGAAGQHAGDTGFRGAVGVIFDGRATSHLQWAINAGMLWRPRASLNLASRGHGTVRSALQAGLGVAYVAPDDRFRIGPELVFSTGADETAFTTVSTRLELLVGGAYRLADVVEIGPAVGFGIARSAGTPDVRGLLRIALLPFGRRDERPTSSTEPSQQATAEERPAQEERGPSAPAEVPPSTPGPLNEEAAPVRDAPTTGTHGPETPAAPVAETPAASTGREDTTMRGGETLQPGALVVTVTFASDSDALSGEALAAIDQAIEELGGIHNVRLTIDGHGDRNGPERWNETLSVLRARNVERHLLHRGLSADRLTVRGYGSRSPVASNGTASGRAANRRVEVRVEARSD